MVRLRPGVQHACLVCSVNTQHNQVRVQYKRSYRPLSEPCGLRVFQIDWEERDVPNVAVGQSRSHLRLLSSPGQPEAPATHRFQALRAQCLPGR